MKDIISKEMLSEVMQLSILEVGKLDDCYLSFKYYILDDDCIDACINVYELAYKCKEWAKYNHIFGNSGYNIYTEHLKGTNYKSALGKQSESKDYDYWGCFFTFINKDYISKANTEYEAIFKACEWILKEVINENHN